MLLPEILPDTLDRAIGMTVNQSPWYKIKEAMVWPAIGQGYNTGVMLLDLKKLRQTGWMQRWRQVAMEETKKHGHVYLADQDLMNAAIVRQPYLLYTLPCEWNLQINDWNEALRCPVEQPYTRPINLFRSRSKTFKIAHLNTKRKSEFLASGLNFTSSVNTGHPEKVQWRQFYVKRYHMFREYDPRWLTDKLAAITSSRKETPSTVTANSQLCSQFEEESRIQRRVHAFYLEYNFTDFNQLDSRNTVTLISQMSYQRLHRLEQLVSTWSGPISIALYLTEQEAYNLSIFVAESEILSRRRNIGYHVMFVEGSMYPINQLRNLALLYARTDFVFHLDVDFIPSANLHDVLQNLIKQRWSKVQWSADYEPYVVVHRDAPKFDARFVGFGWNKASYIMSLDATGYRMFVLPDVFVLHLPHSPSVEVLRYRSSFIYRHCIDKMKLEFIKQLAKEHGVLALKYLDFRKFDVKPESRLS
ncbi:unnamed protein product [Echinostoma caproni]|uniref:Glycosyltransferase-like protein LARGE1 n=1 Tax=Echinostoma caproni TaxID=27848 RepID=A0A183A6Q5_9TREM|nr:unnamed protein product [Echinostoma caproni]